MVKSYRDFLNNSNSNNNYRPKTDDNEKEDNNAYLDVWKVNPSYEDINTRETVLKATSLVVIGLLFFTSMLYTTYNLALSIGITGIVSISFIMAFHKSFFSLHHLLDFRSFELLGDLVFWQTKHDNYDLTPSDMEIAHNAFIRLFIYLITSNLDSKLLTGNEKSFYKNLRQYFSIRLERNPKFLEKI